MKKDLHFPSLRNPPLVETALSVFVQSEHLNDESARELVAKVAPDFVYSEPIVENSLNIDLTSPDRGLTKQEIWRGARFKRGERLVLTLRNLIPGMVEIAFSMLKPYSQWADFIAEARMRVLPAVSQIAAHAIKRIGLRCLDRVLAPLEHCAMADLVKTAPSLPEGLEDAEAREFFLRETRFCRDLGLYVTLIRATQPPTNDGRIPIVIDTDVFMPLDRLVSEDEFGRILENMRYAKNAAFFGTIGNKLLEGCK